MESVQSNFANRLKIVIFFHQNQFYDWNQIRNLVLWTSPVGLQRFHFHWPIHLCYFIIMYRVSGIVIKLDTNLPHLKPGDAIQRTAKHNEIDKSTCTLYNIEHYTKTSYSIVPKPDVIYASDVTERSCVVRRRWLAGRVSGSARGWRSVRPARCAVRLGVQQDWKLLLFQQLDGHWTLSTVRRGITQRLIPEELRAVPGDWLAEF